MRQILRTIDMGLDIELRVEDGTVDDGANDTKVIAALNIWIAEADRDQFVADLRTLREKYAI